MTTMVIIVFLKTIKFSLQTELPGRADGSPEIPLLAINLNETSSMKNVSPYPW
jgi:hypothetical protein